MGDDNVLLRCQEEIRRLTAENEDLRRAALGFGQLAERLNRELRTERQLRAAAHRRRTPTSTLSKYLVG